MYCLLILFLCLDSDWYTLKHLNVLGFCFIKLIFVLGKNSTICKIDSQWEFVMWHRELNPVICPSLGGRREGGLRGRAHMYTYGQFIYMCGRNQCNFVKQLPSNFFFLSKKKLVPCLVNIFLVPVTVHLSTVWGASLVDQLVKNPPAIQ